MAGSGAIGERDEKELALTAAREAEDAANVARREVEHFSERLNSSTVLLASGQAHADSQRWPDAYTAYTDATQKLPEYFLVWLERGRLNAKLGRWNAAAADFARAVRIGCPIEQAELSGVPQLLFYAGEPEAYATLCEQLSRGPNDDPMAVEIRGRLVGDLAPPDAAELANRVDRMLAAAQGGADDKSPHRFGKTRHAYTSMYHGVNLYVAGWAHLRAGDNERALARLEESNDARWFGRGIASPLIAIAHHRLGNADAALQAFEQSQALFDRQVDECVREFRSFPSIPWIDWIEFLLHRREASIVVKGHTPAADQRLQQIEQLAEAVVAE